jgi:hypothetical protein
VITTASKYTKEIGPEYVKSFEYLDAMNVGVCILKNEEARTKYFGTVKSS